MKKNINIIIVEDNDQNIKSFKDVLKNKHNITLSAHTKSSDEAITLVRKYSPDAVVLDLELHNGQGSGFDFLNNLKSLNLNYKPLLIVTTNIASNAVYDKLHREFVDLIFYKKQKDYSPNLVIDSLILLAEEPNVKPVIPTDSSPEANLELKNRINKELDIIGISYKLKGREYLFDSIYYLLTEHDENISAFQYLSNKYKLLTSSISRAIQTSINHTWRTSSTEDLKANYTAQINYNTGVPTPTEFIYFIVNKIKN